jgi:hypothetical protein
LIEERGWATGSSAWGSPGGSAALCLEGGIVAALGVNLDDARAHREFEQCPAYRAVQSYLDLDTERHEDGWAEDPLWRWNDRHGSAAEVIEVLRATAVIEAARESEAAEFVTVEVSA